jgi:hypothetical protein
MTYETKVCRTYLDVTEVTKTQLITAILTAKENLGLDDNQVRGLANVVGLSIDATKDSGLNAFQRLGAHIDAEFTGREVEGKRKPKNSKSEAA